VHGNVGLELCTNNALFVLEQLGRTDIPVYRGAAGPLTGGRARTAAILHGDDGLGNTGPARPGLARRPEPAVAELIRRVLAAPGEVTLLVLGPQTNVALAAIAEPDFGYAVEEIIFMGGRITPAHATNPLVSFNIGEDPEAAHIVLQVMPTPVTMLGQEVAFQVTFDPERLERFAALDTAAGWLAASVSRYYVEQQMRLLHRPNGSIPDLAVMAYALRPELFRSRQLWVDVETTGWSRGATVAGSPSYLFHADLVPGEAALQAGGRTVNVPDQIDAEAVVDWYQELLAIRGIRDA
jgi:inosine-uridine nucleoside N-ribohydrolase